MGTLDRTGHTISVKLAHLRATQLRQDAEELYREQGPHVWHIVNTMQTAADRLDVTATLLAQIAGVDDAA